MRIVLLGAPQSGKTAYFSALYHAFQHQLSLPVLTERVRKRYQDMQIRERACFRMEIEDGKLEKELKQKSLLLNAKPILDWPDKTQELNGTKAKIKFDFAEINFIGEGYTKNIKSYTRTLEVDDPPGGVFSGEHVKSNEITDALKKADSAIIFLPMDIIVKTIEAIEARDATADDDDDDEKQEDKFTIDASLAGIMKVLNSLMEKNEYNSVFPCCFVISKTDLVDQKFLDDKVEKFLYSGDKGVITRISKAYPGMIICVCPIGMVNPDTGNFKAMNLEWPFLFSAAATIFRNHYDLLEKAEQDKMQEQEYSNEASSATRAAQARDAYAAEEARKARELANRSWISRAWRGLNGETVSKYRSSESFWVSEANSKRSEANQHWEMATTYRNAAGRKVEFAKDDRGLALDTWASLSVEGDARRIRIMVAGDRINVINENTLKGKKDT